MKLPFFGADDAVSAYRKELLAALNDGDVERLRDLLKRDIEVPPKVLDEVLNKAVKQNKIRMTRAVLAAGGTRSLDIGTARGVVYDGHTEMFRLLSDHGWNFSSFVPAENGGSYIAQLRFMNKDYEADKLRQELQAVKAELTALRKAQGLPEPEEAPKPLSTPKKFAP